MSFETLGLAPSLLATIKKSGYDTPSPVQAAAIPAALEGKDLIVSAQTGSGKTAAFMLPSLNKLTLKEAHRDSGVQVLVLTPTRELAMQVTKATDTYGQAIKSLKTATIVGGMPYGAQIKALSRRVDIIVATPGRLIDHIKARRINLKDVHTLILDEADRMLDMGFIDDIEEIAKSLPKQRQTLMFSATFEGSIARLAEEMLNNPVRIDIANQKQKHQNITQSIFYADNSDHKLRLLDHLLRDTSVDQAIVFTATKRGADDLADYLDDAGFSASALHGDMNQRQRTRTLTMLQRGQVRVLVATDVAARGIDVQGISHAINYDLPMQAEDYVHRIGRTGRAGRSGLAYTLATHRERHKVRRIESFIGQDIETAEIPGLEPTQTFEKSRGGNGGGKRRGGGGERFAGKGNGGSRGGKSYSGSRDSAPRERKFADGPRPERSEGRSERAPRPEFRSEGRTDRAPRSEFRSEGRTERAPRPEFRSEGRTDRAPRGEGRPEFRSEGRTERAPRSEFRSEGRPEGRKRKSDNPFVSDKPARAARSGSDDRAPARISHESQLDRFARQSPSGRRSDSSAPSRRGPAPAGAKRSSSSAAPRSPRRSESRFA